MRYQVLPQADVTTAVEALLSNPGIDVDPFLKWAGEGAEADYGQLGDIADALHNHHAGFLTGQFAKDKDQFEGTVSANLHRTLTAMSVPNDVLDEPGFWAAMSIKYFWWFVWWRQQATFESGESQKYRKYVDGYSHTECVLLRSYLRGRLAHRLLDPNPYRLCTGIAYGTDFWRSHVLRVQTGNAKVITQAFASAQIEDRMDTDPLRAYARRLNRTWSNVVLHVYDEDDAAALITELR